MAHIIGDIAVMPRIAKRVQLSCMGKTINQICKKDIYDTYTIQQKIEQAAIIKKQLEVENFERDRKIMQHTEAGQQLNSMI